MIDLTAFPVAEGEDAWPADQSLLRYLDADLPADRVLVSPGAGGCWQVQGGTPVIHGTFERVEW